MIGRRLARGGVSGAWLGVVMAAGLVPAACSNGSADSTEHGFNYEAGADTYVGGDGAPNDGGADSTTPQGDSSMGMNDSTVPPADTGVGSDTSEDTAPPEDAPNDAAADSEHAPDTSSNDTGTGPTDSATMTGMDSSADTGTVAMDSGGGMDSNVDTGAVAMDTGTGVTDTGSAPTDTGTAPPESGTDAGCTSTMAILAGTSSTAVAATWKDGAWGTPQTLAGSVTSPPALASNGSAYVGVVSEATTNYLEYTVGTTSWTALAGVPAASGTATTIGPPTFAVIGGAVHLVYIGTNHDYYHGLFNASAWTPADDPVGVDGGVQTFAPAAPTAAAQTAGFDIAFAGQDSHLYTQGWDGSWGGTSQLATDAYNVVSPRIVTLTGGTASQMIVYSRNDNGNDEVLMYTVLTGTSWSAPAIVNSTMAYTPNTVSIVALANGAALLVYEGANGQPYWVTYSPASATPWTAPLPLQTTGNPTLSSPPQLAPGVCGVDAVLVLPETGGPLSVSTFSGSAWSAPAAALGATTATFAAIATQP